MDGSRFRYIPYVTDEATKLSGLKEAFKSKKEVIIITSPEFYDAILTYGEKESKSNKKLIKGLTKTAAVGVGIGVGLSSMPATILLGALSVSGLIDLGGSFPHMAKGLLFNYLKDYTPLLDSTHRYVYLFKRGKKGYQDGTPIDTSRVYSDTTQKVELRGLLTKDICIPNVNNIQPNDSISRAS